MHVSRDAALDSPGSVTYTTHVLIGVDDVCLFSFLADCENYDDVLGHL